MGIGFLVSLRLDVQKDVALQGLSEAGRTLRTAPWHTRLVPLPERPSDKRQERRLRAVWTHGLGNGKGDG